MNIFFILFLFFRFFLVSSHNLNLNELMFINNLNSFLYNFHNNNNEEEEFNPDTFTFLLIHTFQAFMSEVEKKIELYPLEEKYKKILKKIFMEKKVNNATKYFFTKVFGDSSKNKNDIQKYENCMFETYGGDLEEIYTDEIFIQKPLFYIIYLDVSNNKKITTVSHRASKYMFGLCFPKISYPLFTFEEEKKWAEDNFKNLTILFSYHFGNLFNLSLQNEDALQQVEIISVFNQTLQNKQFNLRENKYLNLIPFYIFLIIIILISSIRIFPFF